MIRTQPVSAEADEACFAAVYETIGEKARERLEALLLTESSGRAWLEAGLEELIGAVARFPDLARSLLLEATAAGERPRTERRQLFDHISYLLDFAWGTGGVRTQPSTRAVFVVGAVDGVLSRALLDGDLSRFEAAIPDLVEMAAALLSRGADRQAR